MGFEITQGVEIERRGVGFVVSEGKKAKGVRLSRSAVLVIEGTLKI
jgi:hypothetical protein